jgi:hypothetical protein
MSEPSARSGQPEPFPAPLRSQILFPPSPPQPGQGGSSCHHCLLAIRYWTFSFPRPSEISRPSLPCPPRPCRPRGPRLRPSLCSLCSLWQMSSSSPNGAGGAHHKMPLTKHFFIPIPHKRLRRFTTPQRPPKMRPYAQVRPIIEGPLLPAVLASACSSIQLDIGYCVFDIGHSILLGISHPRDIICEKLWLNLLFQPMVR